MLVFNVRLLLTIIHAVFSVLNFASLVLFAEQQENSVYKNPVAFFPQTDSGLGETKPETKKLICKWLFSAVVEEFFH